MKNIEVLQIVHDDVGCRLQLNADGIKTALDILIEANEKIKDVGTYDRIRALHLLYAEVDYLAKRISTMQFVERCDSQAIKSLCPIGEAYKRSIEPNKCDLESLEEDRKMQDYLGG